MLQVGATIVGWRGAGCESVLERKGITTTARHAQLFGTYGGFEPTARTLLEVQLRNLAAGSGGGRSRSGMSVMGFVGTAESRLNDADEAADPWKNRQSGRRDLL